MILIFREFNNSTNSLKSLLSCMGMLDCNKVKKNFQPLLRRERTIKFAIRLLRLGKGVKFARDLFHPASIPFRQRHARKFR